MTHICVSKLTITGSDNGLSPGQHQAIILTNAGIMWIVPLGTNFSEILLNQNLYIFIQENAFENVWKMAFILSRPQCVKNILAGLIQEKLSKNKWNKIHENYIVPHETTEDRYTVFSCFIHSILSKKKKIQQPVNWNWSTFLVGGSEISEDLFQLMKTFHDCII